MKRSTILLSLIVSTLFLASYTVLKTSGSHPGSTGAPGELTCAQSGCHANATVMQDSGLVNTLLFSSIDTSYTPGNSYTLTLQVAKPNITKFGFELVALKDSTDTNIGSFTLLEPTRTQVLQHVVGGLDLRYSMSHKSAGTTTATPGAIQWKMLWTAPPVNAGTITFWYTTNCTNNNGLGSGDQLFLSHFQIHPSDTTGGDTSIVTSLNKHTIDQRFIAYQDDNSQRLLLKYTSVKEQNANIVVYDVTGKLILEQSIELQAGDNFEKITLPENCCKGTYSLKFFADDKVYTKKIILE